MNHKVNFKKVVFFQALSPVHMGAGQGLDHIDLPIQREQHTKYPIFYASGIKGALRQYALERAIEECRKEVKDNKLTLSKLDNLVEKQKCNEDNKNEEECSEQIKALANIFGSQDCRGKITITDAKILFFPVKSLKGIFAYVSCPFVLERYADNTENKKLLEIVKKLNLKEGEILASPKLIVEKIGKKERIVLEEFELEMTKEEEEKLSAEILNNLALPKEILQKISYRLAIILNHLALPKELLQKISYRIAIVDDETFGYFVENFTEVVNRIKVNPETGTVKEGGLWTEEYLPAESVLYSLWFESEELTEKEEKYLPPNNSLLILGGDQTIGKGLVKLYLKEVLKDENG
jgi:CRISPR-associated protein Cmr4